MPPTAGTFLYAYCNHNSGYYSLPFDFYKQSAWEILQENICHFTHYFRDMFISVKL